MKNFIQIGLIVLIVGLFTFILVKTPFKELGSPKNQSVTIDKGNLPPLGLATAPITVIEFGDFLCPFCARVVTDLYPQLENLIQQGKVAIYFRDFVVHPQAVPIHNAARCANEQGKYWEFNKEIFKKFMNGEITTKKEVWLNLANELGLDLQSFEKCVDENRYFNDIQKDNQEAYNLGLQGTPTFFINGKKIEGINIPAIMSTINQLLQQ